MSDYLFEKEFRILGIHRSGVSSCVSYIYNHLPSRETVYLHRTKFTLIPKWHDKWSHEEEKCYRRIINKFDSLEDKRYCINSIEHLSLWEFRENYEDLFSKYNRDTRKIAAYYGKEKFARDVYNIVILRSPHNNLADLYRSYQTRIYRYDFLYYWLEYASEYLENTNYIYEMIPFNFDKWFISKEYQREFSKKLGISYERFDNWFKSTSKKQLLIAKGYHQEGYALDSYDKLMKGNDSWCSNALYICSHILSNKRLQEYTNKIFHIDLREIIN